MKVVVVPSDPEWPTLFKREAASLANALQANALAIHHIGSTAISGIHAKPIIDVLIEVSSLDVLERQSSSLESLGYEALGEFGIAGRRYFRKCNAAGVRTHHVHAFQIGHPEITRHLDFRDFLNAHPDRAKQYSDLKQHVAATHMNDHDAYMDGKDAFIKETDQLAEAWRRSMAS